MYYVLICLALSLVGLAGFQLIYMMYLDQIAKMRRSHIKRLEERCRYLDAEVLRLNTELRIFTSSETAAARSESNDDVLFADVIEDN